MTDLTTAALPDDMKYLPDHYTTRAVRGSGLTIAGCRHYEPACRVCVPAAARHLIAALEGAP